MPTTTENTDHEITGEDLIPGEDFNGGLATLVAYDLSGDAAPHLGTVLGVMPADHAESGAKYVAWTVNLETGGYAHGDYSFDLESAVEDYESKQELNNR